MNDDLNNDSFWQEQQKRQARFDRDVRLVNVSICSFTGFAVLAVISHYWCHAIATTVIWALGCFVVGTTFGFLFGIPKVLPNTDPKNQNNTPAERKNEAKDDSARNPFRQQPNTNLTDISDWLTKIIVGVGLMQLKEMPGLLRRISLPLAQSINPEEPLLALASGIVICFLFTGFLFGYMSTRTFLSILFQRADQGGYEDLLARTNKLEAIQVQSQEAAETALHVASDIAAKTILDPAVSDRNQIESGGQAIAAVAKQAERKPAEQRTYNEWFLMAADVFNTKKYADAVSMIKNALSAKPPPEFFWGAYNRLGLAYHYQQSKDWKKGDSMDWYKGAIEWFDKAIAVASFPDQALLSKANKAFVYMDAEEFTESEDLAIAVIKESPTAADAVRIADLARIVAAAASVTSAPDRAADYLNKVASLVTFEYLFKDEDVPQPLIQKLVAAPRLNESVRVTLKRFVRN